MKKIYCTLLILTAFCFANAQQANMSKTDEMVRTPEGLRLKSNIHHIESTCHLSIENGRILKRNNKTGNLMQDYGEATIHGSVIENNRIAQQNSTNATDSTFGSGWITYAYWTNTSTKPISYFSTNWIVPNNPVTDSGQTVFLFNGIDPANPSDAILQPVLQWGPSAAGGGSYWAITNWYVPSTGQAFWGDSLVIVTPGTNLQGVMVLTSDSASGFSYNSSFVGYPTCSLQVNNIAELKWANQTMEVYGTLSYLNYPPDTSVSMSAISILTGTINPTHPTVTWHKQNVVTDVGQHCLIGSNSSTNGDVDLYFHTPPVPSTVGLNTIVENKLFKVYPNPACNLIVIEKQNITTQNTIISIKNIQGQELVVYKLISATDKNTIDVSGLNSGVYFLSFITETENYMEKIIIQK